VTTHYITVAKSTTLHIRESDTHEYYIGRIVVHNDTHEGILPAPNAWTPFPGKHTTKIVNRNKKTDLEKDIWEGERQVERVVTREGERIITCELSLASGRIQIDDVT
jgi:hypothetical protein